MPSRKVRHLALCFLPFTHFPSCLVWLIHLIFKGGRGNHAGKFIKTKTKLYVLISSPTPEPRRTSPVPPAASSPAPLRKWPPPAATIRNCASPWKCQPGSRKGRSFSSHARRGTSSNSPSWKMTRCSRFAIKTPSSVCPVKTLSDTHGCRVGVERNALQWWSWRTCIILDRKQTCRCSSKPALRTGSVTLRGAGGADSAPAFTHLPGFSLSPGLCESSRRSCNRCL